MWPAHVGSVRCIHKKPPKFLPGRRPLQEFLFLPGIYSVPKLRGPPRHVRQSSTHQSPATSHQSPVTAQSAHLYGRCTLVSHGAAVSGISEIPHEPRDTCVIGDPTWSLRLPFAPPPHSGMARKQKQTLHDAVLRVPTDQKVPEITNSLSAIHSFLSIKSMNRITLDKIPRK